MARLVLYPRTPLAREIQLKPGENFIGRGFANDHRLEDASVSGSHCQIVISDGTCVIRDLGSTNGTYLNRVQVKEAALLHGQTLHLGGVEAIFEADGATSILAQASPAHAVVPAPAMAASPTGPTTIIRRPDAPPAAVPPHPTAYAAAIPAPAAAAAPYAPPAPETAPSQGEFHPAPPGKTACKFHPKTAGKWLCRKCSELYCSVCVGSRPVDGGTGYFCRKCGTQCVPVQVNFVPAREKGTELKEYSDVQVLVRAILFGGGAALGVTLAWIGLAWVMTFQAPFVECIGMGAACGYAVKIGCQDRPSIVFSLIACIWTILGVIVAFVGAAIVMNMLVFGNLIYLTIGMVAGLFLAFKFGGGDF